MPASESQHGAGSRLPVGSGIVAERALQLESGKSDIVLHSLRENLCPLTSCTVEAL